MSAADKCTCTPGAPCTYCLRKALLFFIGLTRPPPPPELHYHCPILPYIANAVIDHGPIRFLAQAPITCEKISERAVIFENQTAEMIFRWAAEQYWKRYMACIRAVYSVERDDDTGMVILWTDAGRLATLPLAGNEIPLPLHGPPRRHPSYAQPYWPKGRRVEA